MPMGIERMRRRVRVGNLSHPTLAGNNSGAKDERNGIPSLSSSVINLHEEPYNEDELEEYRQLFDLFDTDGSGAIGNEELKKAILNFGHQATDAEVDELIQEVDEDGNGEIDFEEFCHCMRSQKLKLASNDEFVRQCFSIFDQDKNGVISQNEFMYIAKEVGGFTTELAEQVFDELDVSSNGYLSADQFGAICADYMLNDQSQLYAD